MPRAPARDKDLPLKEDIRLLGRLLGETLRARRADRLKGGLGLLRLVSENRFRLAARYEQEHLTVYAVFPLGGIV